jgi:subtilase family serine protease
MNHLRRRLLLFLPLLTVALLPAHAAERQALRGQLPPAARNLKPIGAMAASEQLSLAISLPMRNQEIFGKLLRDVYDPASPQFHHYLTPQQIADQFGPALEDYTALIQFAQTNGLTVTDVHADRTLLRVKGSAGDIQRIFHLNLLVYQHPTEPRTFYAPDVEPSVDLALPILAVSGLSDYSLPHPGGHRGKPEDRPAGASPGSGSGPGGAYSGYDYRAAYLPGVTLTGIGQAVGLLELDAYFASDIGSYESGYGLPSVTLSNVLVDGATGYPDGDGNSVGEVSLDIEMTISMAPGLSKVIVYESPNCCYYWLDLLKRMQEDNAAKQLSCSWLFDFDDPSAEPIYQQMALQGQSFFQCSGDYLAFYNEVPQWTDDTNVTLVGGTILTTTGAKGSWVSERTWINGDGTNGSGGGISSSYMGNFAIPPWQQGISTSANKGSTVNRNVPDVALVAYDAWVIWDGGSKDWWWGTSIAAPLWAGFTALVNQQAAANGQLPVGFLNPAIYAIGKSSLYGSCFHDITTGNNTNKFSGGLFPAVPGYDLCTGWGTPNGSNLINALSLSTPIKMQASQAHGSVTLTWNAIPGQNYRVQYSSNLAGTNWLALTNALATNSPMTAVDAVGSRRFYRVVMIP